MRLKIPHQTQLSSSAPARRHVSWLALCRWRLDPPPHLSLFSDLLNQSLSLTLFMSSFCSLRYMGWNDPFLPWCVTRSTCKVNLCTVYFVSKVCKKRLLVLYAIQKKLRAIFFPFFLKTFLRINSKNKNEKQIKEKKKKKKKPHVWKTQQDVLSQARHQLNTVFI